VTFIKTPPEGYQYHLMPDGNWELLPVGTPPLREENYIPVIVHEEDFE
jgi:hypothetical protein